MREGPVEVGSPDWKVKVTRCKNCDGWWKLGSLLNMARDELERLDRPLREIREVFDSDVRKRYSGQWEKVRAIEMIFPSRPSIFQLSEVLAAARGKERAKNLSVLKPRGSWLTIVRRCWNCLWATAKEDKAP